MVANGEESESKRRCFEGGHHVLMGFSMDLKTCRDSKDVSCETPFEEGMTSVDTFSKSNS